MRMAPTTTGRTIWRRLRAAGVACTADHGDLVLKPASRVPADLLASVRRHKAELIAYLSGTPRTTEGRPFVTGRLAWHRLRRAGITPAVEAGRLVLPPASVLPPGLADDLDACRSELLAITEGDYGAAAFALIERVPVADPDHQVMLADYWYERAAVLEVDGMDRGWAQRQAYADLARRVERESLHCCNADARSAPPPASDTHPSSDALECVPCGNGVNPVKTETTEGIADLEVSEGIDDTGAAPASPPTAVGKAQRIGGCAWVLPGRGPYRGSGTVVSRPSLASPISPNKHIKAPQ